MVGEGIAEQIVSKSHVQFLVHLWLRRLQPGAHATPATVVPAI
jgi:hypothetical protein